jgi:hypothetical protein
MNTFVVKLTKNLRFNVGPGTEPVFLLTYSSIALSVISVVILDII